MRYIYIRIYIDGPGWVGECEATILKKESLRESHFKKLLKMIQELYEL